MSDVLKVALLDEKVPNAINVNKPDFEKIKA
jgi:hypothetical protein